MVKKTESKKVVKEVKAKKVAKVERFVQLVEKVNGKIVKNQSITIEDFVFMTVGRKIEAKEYSFSIFDRIFNYSLVKNSIAKYAKAIAFNKVVDIVTESINALIEADTTPKEKKAEAKIAKETKKVIKEDVKVKAKPVKAKAKVVKAKAVVKKVSKRSAKAVNGTKY